MVLGLKTDVLAGNVLSARLTPWSPYRNKYFAPYVNGIYTGQNGQNVKSYFTQDVLFQATIPFNSKVGSIFFEDAGDWSTFPPGYDPSGNAEANDALTANQIQIAWTGNYSLTSPTGDTQITIQSVIGAKRFYNVGAVPGRRTRGRLYYTIQTINSGTYGEEVHIVRFWALNGQSVLLVAEGYTPSLLSTGDSNGESSGQELTATGLLSVQFSLDYVQDVLPPSSTNPGAFFDVCWNAGYQIHYSIEPLVFPRTPEAIVQDTGTDNYIYLSPVIPGGVYNFNVLPINDDGVVQGSAFPTTLPLTLNAAPAPPQITGVSGDASGLSINWTVGETGCIYTVFSSLKNTPINFEGTDLPTPIITGVDANTATLLPITDYSTVDYTPDFMMLASAFDGAVQVANAAFDAVIGQITGGQSIDFNEMFALALDYLDAALANYSAALSLDFTSYQQIIAGMGNGVLQTSTANPTDWGNAVGSAMQQFLSGIGSILDGNPARYTFSDGTMSGATPIAMQSIYQVSLVSGQINGLVQTAQIRIVVRASKGGIQEQTNQEFIITLDNAGNIIEPQPNPANIESLTVVNSLTINVRASVIEDAFTGQATGLVADEVQLFIIPHDSQTDGIAGSSSNDGFDFTSPVDTQPLGVAYGNYHNTNLSYTVPAPGWYDVAVKAAINNTSGTVLSGSYKPSCIYLSNTTPDSVLNLAGKVIRGRGNAGNAGL